MPLQLYFIKTKTSPPWTTTNPQAQNNSFLVANSIENSWQLSLQKHGAGVCKGLSRYLRISSKTFYGECNNMKCSWALKKKAEKICIVQLWALNTLLRTFEIPFPTDHKSFRWLFHASRLSAYDCKWKAAKYVSMYFQNKGNLYIFNIVWSYTVGRLLGKYEG